jgi:uncharacterized membrane protein
MSTSTIGRDQIDQLVEAGHLNAAARDAALAMADVTPDSARWQQFLSRLFLLLGVTFLAAAVGYFIACNWDVMGRFAKIGLLEAGLVAATIVALRWDADSLIARAALLAAVLLTGPLLAFVGQTYQTGADTYELFCAWALLALPWVLVAKWRPIWCLWLLLVNVAVALYFGEAWRPMVGSFFESYSALVHLVINAGFLIVFERWVGARVSGGGRSVERFALAMVLAAACFLYMIFIFDSRDRTWWQPLVALATFAVAWFAYRLWRIDVAALALWSFGGIIAITATVAKIMSAGRMEIAAFLFTGLTVIGLSALAAMWLRNVHRESEVA